MNESSESIPTNLLTVYLKSSWHAFNIVLLNLSFMSAIVLYCVCLCKEWRPTETRKTFDIHDSNRGVLNQVKLK